MDGMGRMVVGTGRMDGTGRLIDGWMDENWINGMG
jgi:hypothetical protein